MYLCHKTVSSYGRFLCSSVCKLYVRNLFPVMVLKTHPRSKDYWQFFQMDCSTLNPWVPAWRIGCLTPDIIHLQLTSNDRVKPAFCVNNTSNGVENGLIRPTCSLWSHCSNIENDNDHNAKRTNSIGWNAPGRIHPRSFNQSRVCIVNILVVVLVIEACVTRPSDHSMWERAECDLFCLLNLCQHVCKLKPMIAKQNPTRMQRFQHEDKRVICVCVYTLALVLSIMSIFTNWYYNVFHLIITELPK